MKTVGAHTPCSCGYMQDGGLYFYIKDYQGNVRVVLNQANRPVEINSYYPYGGLMAATTTEGTQPYKYSTKELDRVHTKGTVLLVCLRCVDIHWSCVETCRRHVPTLRCDLRPRLLWQA